MGHRLNIELAAGNELLCNCYWEEAAYTDTALDITEAIIRTYDDIFGSSGANMYTAVKTLEAMGGGITGIERQRIKKTMDISGTGLLELPAARSIYEGIISVSKQGIKETRRWETARVRIDLSGKIFDFHAHEYTWMEDYIDLYDRIPGLTPWEELPRIEAGPDIFTGIYWDRLPMVRRIVEQHPNGFRINNGDVIEWM